MDKPKYFIIDKTEGFLQSVAKDTVTFGFLLLCIYVSQGSAWWTFLTGCMFLLFAAGKFKSRYDETPKFKTLEELKKYVDAL